MTVVSRPLFRLDAGWPFVLAGLVMLVAVVVLPGRRGVHDMRAQLDLLQTQEVVTIERLNAYTQFLDGIRSGDPQLLRRLGASQLNLVPDGETPILVAASLDQTVPAWIDQTVAPVSVRDRPYADTLLIRLAEGQWRVWLLAGSVFVIFLGLVLGPDMASRPRRRNVPTGDRLLPGAVESIVPIGLLAAASGEAIETGVADAAIGSPVFDGPVDDAVDGEWGVAAGAAVAEVAEPSVLDDALELDDVTGLDDVLELDSVPAETLDSEELEDAADGEVLDDEDDDLGASIAIASEPFDSSIDHGMPHFDLASADSEINDPAEFLAAAPPLATHAVAEPPAPVKATVGELEPIDEARVAAHDAPIAESAGDVEDHAEVDEVDEITPIDDAEPTDEIVTLDEITSIDATFDDTAFETASDRSDDEAIADLDDDTKDIEATDFQLDTDVDPDDDDRA